jgi:pantetheine-phosphate adenylyltransferase
MPERAALYTGSFDPLTNGHVDVLKNAAAIFDRIVVAIGVHPGKMPMFSPQGRADLIRASCKSLLEAEHCTLEVVTFSGLAVTAPPSSCVGCAMAPISITRRKWLA